MLYHKIDPFCNKFYTLKKRMSVWQTFLSRAQLAQIYHSKEMLASSWKLIGTLHLHKNNNWLDVDWHLTYIMGNKTAANRRSSHFYQNKLYSTTGCRTAPLHQPFIMIETKPYLKHCHLFPSIQFSRPPKDVMLLMRFETRWREKDIPSPSGNVFNWGYKVTSGGCTETWSCTSSRLQTTEGSTMLA